MFYFLLIISTIERNRLDMRSNDKFETAWPVHANTVRVAASAFGRVGVSLRWSGLVFTESIGCILIF